MRVFYENILKIKNIKYDLRRYIPFIPPIVFHSKIISIIYIFLYLFHNTYQTIPKKRNFWCIGCNENTTWRFTYPMIHLSGGKWFCSLIISVIVLSKLGPVLNGFFFKFSLVPFLLLLFFFCFLYYYYYYYFNIELVTI